MTESTRKSERLTALMPFRIVSVANLREHWSSRARRAARQRRDAYILVGAMLRNRGIDLRGATRIRIDFRRHARRRMDNDNLAAAFKAARDGVADALGINDGDTRLVWRYLQRPPGARSGCEFTTISIVIEW